MNLGVEIYSLLTKEEIKDRIQKRHDQWLKTAKDFDLYAMDESKDEKERKLYKKTAEEYKHYYSALMLLAGDLGIEFKIK